MGRAIRAAIVAGPVTGVMAAARSGLACCASSGIRTGPSAHGAPNLAVPVAARTFAFLPGFLVLVWRR
jgi:hypothetical protein